MSMLVRKGTMLHRSSTRRHHHNNNKVNGRKNSAKKPTTPMRRTAAPEAADNNEKAVTVVVTTDTTDAGVLAARKLASVVTAANNASNTQQSQSINSCKVIVYDHNNGETSTMTSYGSFTYQLKAASEESSGLCEYVCRALEIIANTVAVTILIVLCIFLTFAMIIFGIQHLENCPKEPNIPVYLLVGGCFGFLKMVSLLWRQTKSRRYDRLDYTFNDNDFDELTPSVSSRVTHHVLTIFLLAWFGLGNYWIFRIYKPRFQPLLFEPNNWCDQNVYAFALAHCYICYFLISSFIVLVVVLFFGHACGCL